MKKSFQTVPKLSKRSSDATIKACVIVVLKLETETKSGSKLSCFPFVGVNLDVAKVALDVVESMAAMMTKERVDQLQRVTKSVIRTQNSKGLDTKTSNSTQRCNQKLNKAKY